MSMPNNSNYNLEPVSLDEFQDELLRLFNVVVKSCDHLNLEYWVDSGTLLGAVRHKGFIPWDDDLDLSLMKPDFDKLVSYLGNDEIAREYKCSLYYGKDNHSYWSDYLSSSEYVFKNYRGELVPCHIDLFPFKALNDENRDMDRYLTNMAMYFVAGKTKYKNLMDRDVLSLNKDDLFIKKKAWIKSFNNDHISSLGLIDETTQYLTYSFEDFPYSYERPIFNVDEIYPLTTKIFEGLTVKAPNNSHSFLEKLYGDYMSLPPISQREPFGIGFYKVNADDAALIKLNYIESQFNNFYDRHKISNAVSRAFLTLKHSGFSVLRKKITSYIRF